MNIILEPIPAPHPKLLLLYRKIAKDIALFIFYINDIFKVFKIYKKQLIFVHDNFFPYIV